MPQSHKGLDPALNNALFKDRFKHDKHMNIGYVGLKRCKYMRDKLTIPKLKLYIRVLKLT